MDDRSTWWSTFSSSMIYHPRMDRGWLEKLWWIRPWGPSLHPPVKEREIEREREERRREGIERVGRGPTLITTPPNFLVIIWWFQQRDRISSRIPERAFHLDNQSLSPPSPPPRMPRAQSFPPIPRFSSFSSEFGDSNRIESIEIERSEEYSNERNSGGIGDRTGRGGAMQPPAFFRLFVFCFFSREEKKVKTKRYRKTRDKSVGRGEANNWTVPLGG